MCGMTLLSVFSVAQAAEYSYTFVDTGQIKYFNSSGHGSQGDAVHIYNFVLAVHTVPEPDDFDGDEDVDGADFLAWQRGESPNLLSQSDLASLSAPSSCSSCVP